MAVPYTLIVEKSAGHSVAKGKRVFKNRVITEKGRNNPLIRLELPDDFLELTLKLNSPRGRG